MARLLPLNMAKPVANTVGTMAPPTKPWMARNTVMDWMFQASPHMQAGKGEQHGRAR